MKTVLALLRFMTMVALLLHLPASLAQSNDMDMQQKAQTAYRRLLSTDPLFSESEKAFANAKRRFLSRFTENTRPMALALLKLDTTWDILQQLDGHLSERLLHGVSAINRMRGHDYVRERAGIMRYMKLVAETSRRDTAWLILMRPVCLTTGAGYYSVDGWNTRPAWRQIEQTLAEFDAHTRGGPDTYTAIDIGKRGLSYQLQHFPGRFKPQYYLRKVDGNIWGTILMSGQELQASGSVHRQIALAYVLPYQGKQFEIIPILSPLLEDCYPSYGKHFSEENRRQAFTPSGASDGSPVQQKGPKGEHIRMGALQGIIQISNKTGPFVFTVTAKDLKRTDVSDDGKAGKAHYQTQLVYHVVPECALFSYTWNPVEKTYIREPASCHEKGHWGAFVPFEKNLLLPVEAAYTAFLKNARLRNHHKKLEKTASAFFSLFGNEEKKCLKTSTPPGGMTGSLHSLTSLRMKKNSLITSSSGIPRWWSTWTE